MKMNNSKNRSKTNNKRNQGNIFNIPQSSRKSREINNFTKEKLISKAFHFHSQGNIPEASKYYQIFIC